MKKFTFALVAAAFAVCANAATINWSATKGYLYDGAGDSAVKVTSGTAYLVSTGLSQADLVAIFVGAEGDTSATLTSLQGNANYLGTGTVGSNARISGNITTSIEDDITAYFVVFNGDKMFISDTASSTYDGLTKEHTLPFTSAMSTPSKATTTVGPSGSFASSSWYAYSAPTPPGPGPIPEPTTAALLALGLAAVGLKRKLA